MGTFKDRWKKLAASKKYRESFVAAQAKQIIPFQIRALMKAQGLSQQGLAERSGLTQGVISRAANPGYGNLALNTCFRVAAGFDVAFVGRFVPFSELDRWLDHLHDESLAVPDFKAENTFSEELFSKFDDEYIESEASKWTAVAEDRTEIVAPFLRRPAEGLTTAKGQTGFIFPEGVIGRIVPKAPLPPDNTAKQPAPPRDLLYGRTDRI